MEKFSCFGKITNIQKLQNKTTTLGSKDYLCTDPYVFFKIEKLLIKKFNKLNYFQKL